MREQSRRLRPDVILVALYLLAGLPLQWWSSVATPVPLMNYGAPLWPNLAAYAVAGPLAAYLLWRKHPRARLACYVFLTFDILRSLRRDHWLPVGLDALVILYLQTPAMRALYPSMWSRSKALRDRWAGK